MCATEQLSFEMAFEETSVSDVMKVNWKTVPSGWYSVMCDGDLEDCSRWMVLGKKKGKGTYSSLWRNP